MEAGVFALSRLRIRQQMRAGKPSAKVLHDYLETPGELPLDHPGRQHGGELPHPGLAGGETARGAGRPPGVVRGGVFGRRCSCSTRSSICCRRCCSGCIRTGCASLLARPFRFIHLALRPLVALVEAFSGVLLRWRGGKAFTGHLFGNREELRLVMQESAQAFTSEERTMINRVLDLQTLTVRQVMKPLEQAVAMTAQTPVSAALALCRERQAHPPAGVGRAATAGSGSSGMLALNTLLYQPALDATKPVGDYVKPALFLDEDLRLEVALRRLQRSGQRLAIVLGRDRREIGILSLQDMLKVIFGEVSL